MLSYAITLALAASLGQASQPATGSGNRADQAESRKVDGQWEVVYIEMDGKKVENKNFANVTIQGNKLTCRHEGKEKTWTLEFGPHHRVRAEETTAGASTTGSTSNNSTANDRTSGTHDRFSHGVYIAAKDYLCFSMNHGRDTTGGTGREAGATNNNANNPTTSTESSRDHGAYGSHFVLILHRGGTGTTSSIR